MSSNSAPAHPPLRSHVRGMAVGFALGLIATGSSALADRDDALVLNAILLAWIGSVYIGFAIADGRRSSIGVQIVSALVFLEVGYYGYQLDSRLLLGIGFIAHAAWDWLHHNDHGPTRVRNWYPPFCAVADVVIGVPLLAEWV
jgi:hypothetical protein